MKIASLKPNKKNPRKINSKQISGLKASLTKFGDLSGFIWNERTKRLVGGHQRQKLMPKDANVVIDNVYPTATRTGTKCEGYVEFNGERFKYRQVDWDEATEVEALLAANKHGGDWDQDLLKIVMADFPSMDKEAAGFDIEFPSMNVGSRLSASIPQPVETDEQYVKNTPETTEQIEVGAGMPTSTAAIEKAEEKMDVVGKRFVIIIDCKDAEHKAALRDLINAQVAEAGGKFF